jgi:hypothetical protein
VRLRQETLQTKTMVSPNDSAISVVSQDIKAGDPLSAESPFPTTSYSNTPPQPHSAFTYEELTPAQQTAQDIENDAAIAQAQDEIAIDSASDSQSDAGYESASMASSSTSLSSSIRDHAFENGRRYHKFREGSYNFPNDDSEQEREYMKHAMIMNLCQALHFAPLTENTHNILDMGTGTGAWAIESKSFTLAWFQSMEC